MSDDIQVVPEGAEADDPELARARIAQTRARMSGTIDEIEDVLLRRKEQIQDRLDPFTVVRQRPLQAAGAVFGAGVLLGLLTGGGDDDEDDDDAIHGFDPSAMYRAYPYGYGWNGGSAHFDPDRYERAVSFSADDDLAWNDEGEDDGLGAFAGLRDTIEDRLAPLLGRLARHLLHGNRSA
jgi:ElaB/YqjD/DUF883 family membrane-anchored ribosome-binding protein